MQLTLGRISRRLALLLIVGVLFPARAPAQTALELHGGDRLRLTRQGAVRGVYLLQGCRGDTLLVSRKGDSGTFEIAPHDINLFEILVPRSPGKGALHGAGIGFLIGGAAGLVTGAILGSGPGCAGQSTQEMCFNPGPVLTGAVFGVLGGAAGGILGSVAGFIVPGKRWAEVRPPVLVDFMPGPGLPTAAARTKWNIGGGSFIVEDDRWDTGFHAALSARRSPRRYLESGIVLYCDLWRPSNEAPIGSPVTWTASGRAWLIGLAPTIRFTPAEPRKGTPRLFLEATAGFHGILSNAELHESGPIYGEPSWIVELMHYAPIGMLGEAGIGLSCPMGGFEPELAVKFHGVFGKAENAATILFNLGVGF